MRVQKNLPIVLLSMALLAIGAVVTLETVDTDVSTIGSAAPLGRNVAARVKSDQPIPTGRFTVERGAMIQMRDKISVPTGPRPPKKTKIRPHPRMPISEAKAAQLRREAMNQLPNPMINAVRTGDPMGLGYFSKGAEFPGPNAADNPFTVVPPDPELAVGPNHMIAVVNVRAQAYSKTGTFLGGMDTDAIFGRLGGGCGDTFDPNVLYDEETDRWVLGVDGGGTDYCVGFSQTSDPLGAWALYRITTGNFSVFFDYPHAGLSDDLLVMGSNQFGPNFEARVWAMDKDAGYAGTSLTVVTKALGPVNVSDTPQPVNYHGIASGTYLRGPDHYIIAEDFSGPTFEVWKWADPLGTNSSPVKVATLNWPGGGGFPVSAPTRGGETLTGNDWRPLDAEYSDGTIWTVRTVSCNPGSGVRNCVGWAQVDLSSLTVRQGGVIANQAGWLMFPDIAANACGDAIVGYTGTNANARPAQVLSGHLNTDPLNTMSGFVVIEQGAVDYDAFDGSPHRWGDYTGATPDPDGKGFWYLGEISNGANNNARWGTNIVEVTSQCTFIPE